MDKCNCASYEGTHHRQRYCQDSREVDKRGGGNQARQSKDANRMGALHGRWARRLKVA